MPRIEIRMQTVALVVFLLTIAAAAPFLAGLLPDQTAAAQANPAPRGYPVQELVLDPPPPTVPVAAPDPVDSAYLRAVQVQLQQLRPAATPTDTPPATPGVLVRVATVAGVRLNVRAGPGLDAVVLGGAPSGTLLSVRAVSSDRAWFRVRWNGTDGWVFADLTALVAGDPGELPVAGR